MTREKEEGGGRKKGGEGREEEEGKEEGSSRIESTCASLQEASLEHHCNFSFTVPTSISLTSYISPFEYVLFAAPG